ncbi:MAG: hypothetical protein ACYTGZ_17265 [Planctomycetota bacterium]
MRRITPLLLLGTLAACQSGPAPNPAGSVAVESSGLRRVVVWVDRLE